MRTMLLSALTSTGIAVLAYLVIIGLALALEQQRPAVPGQGFGDFRLNLALMTAFQAARDVAPLVVGGVALAVVSKAGGGLIKLPAHGWGLLWSCLCLVIVAEFFEYVVHRLQHAVPALWALHSLHHSDTQFNVTTNLRHHWLEPFLRTAVVFPLLGLLIAPPPAAVTFYVTLTAWNFAIHFNYRLDFGRWTVLLNCPAYHRLHHSALPEHRDCNFATLLPVFDWVFGTYRRPLPAEVPPTGIDGAARPLTVIEAVTWPLRRRRAAALP